MALNAFVSWVGEQMGCLFRLSRVASSEAEFTPEPRPRGGLGQGGLERDGAGLLSKGRFPTLEQGGDVVPYWRPRRGGLERDGECSAGSRRPRIGRNAELGRGPSVYWASLGPGEDLGAAGELEKLHGIRVQSDDGVVIIGGLFLSRIAVE